MDKSWLLRAEKKEDESSQSLPLNACSGGNLGQVSVEPGTGYAGMKGPNSANYPD